MKLVEAVLTTDKVAGSTRRYQPTRKGQGICAGSDLEILFGMAQIAFSNDLFNLFLRGEVTDIPERIRERNRLRADSTFKRRLQTVESWKRYFREIFPS